MKVGLIYSCVGVAGFNDNRQVGDLEGGWIGHGLASIGASLKYHGHEVALIDTRQCKDWVDVGNRIRSIKADMWGIGVSPVDSPYAVPLAKMIRKLHPKTTVVMGGIHPTLFPERYAVEEVDYVVVGEGELTMVGLASGEKPSSKIIEAVKPMLSDLPWADRDLFDYRRELSCQFLPNTPTPSITMIAGRGCPYHCTFCQPAENAVFGKPYRLRPVDDVIAEMTELYDRYRYTSVTFWDDTFTINPGWIEEFRDKYIDTGIGASLLVNSRVDILCNHPQMVEDMAAMGVKWVVVGAETGSQRLLDFIKKGTTVEQNIEAALMCKDEGIEVVATHMYGLPTETRQESIATFNMVKKMEAAHPFPFWFTPIEGTEIHKYCVDNDLILNKTEGQRSVARTGLYNPTIRNIDYGLIREIMSRY